MPGAGSVALGLRVMEGNNRAMAMAELSTGDGRKTKRWGALLARLLLYSRDFVGIAKPSLCSGVLGPLPF